MVELWKGRIQEVARCSAKTSFSSCEERRVMTRNFPSTNLGDEGKKGGRRGAPPPSRLSGGGGEAGTAILQLE
jgi:hypothetical protein